LEIYRWFSKGKKNSDGLIEIVVIYYFTNGFQKPSINGIFFCSVYLIHFLFSRVQFFIFVSWSFPKHQAKVLFLVVLQHWDVLAWGKPSHAVAILWVVVLCRLGIGEVIEEWFCNPPPPFCFGEIISLLFFFSFVDFLSETFIFIFISFFVKYEMNSYLSRADYSIRHLARHIGEFKLGLKSVIFSESSRLSTRLDLT
jgi:hypothetical protein